MRRVLIATTSQCLRRKKLLGKEESECGKIWTKRELSPGAIKRLGSLQWKKTKNILQNRLYG